MTLAPILVSLLATAAAETPPAADAVPAAAAPAKAPAAPAPPYVPAAAPPAAAAAAPPPAAAEAAPPAAPVAPPTAAPTRAAVEPPPPAWPGTPQQQAMPGAPPPSRREWNVLGGWSALQILGIRATGLQARVASACPTCRGWEAIQLAAEFFTGETAPGLAFKSASFGVERWSDLQAAVRFGLGADVGWVGYDAATPSEGQGSLAVGLRAGAEARLVRWRSVAVVGGAHGSAHLGSWYSGAISLGLRFGASPPGSATSATDPRDPSRRE